MENRIVGLGSPYGSDDEIGLALVRALSQEEGYEECCILLESVDSATVAYSLLEWQRPVILVDAADMGIVPGEYRFFFDSDASLILKTSPVSAHGMGLAEGLGLARTLGYDKRAGIFGVQPFDLSPQIGLTPGMKDRFPLLLAALKGTCSCLL